MGRATQGVRLINLAKKNDTIASVCKVMSSQEEDVEEAEVLNEEEPNAQGNPETLDNLENPDKPQE
jgi:DNA gyrase subunit A